MTPAPFDRAHLFGGTTGECDWTPADWTGAAVFMGWMEGGSLELARYYRDLSMAKPGASSIDLDADLGEGVEGYIITNPDTPDDYATPVDTRLDLTYTPDAASADRPGCRSASAYLTLTEPRYRDRSPTLPEGREVEIFRALARSIDARIEATRASC